MNHAIPFHRVAIVGRETELVAEAVRSGALAGDGRFGRECERLLSATHGSARVLMTSSCTAALEMAAILCDIGPGDEVILPSFTFVSTANAFVLRGATLRFADIDRRTLGLDAACVEKLVTPRTRAVVPVHYAGVGCDMDPLLALASAASIAVVEDNAHGLFGTYRGHLLGTMGKLATLSFHDTKNFTCGEGGALVINDPGLIARAEIIREKGTDRSRFRRGEIDKYTWIDIGSSPLMSEMQAAFLLAQLEQRETVQARRRTIHEAYERGLAAWATRHDVHLPDLPSDRQSAWHLFQLIMPSTAARTAFMEHMKLAGIATASHYVPLHGSPMGIRFGGRQGDCPVTEELSGRLVRLPLHHDLSDGDAARVIDRAGAFTP